MKTINDLITQYGSTYKLAVAMGVSQPQVMRWKQNGAFVDVDTGAVYILTRTVNPLTGQSSETQNQ